MLAKELPKKRGRHSKKPLTQNDPITSNKNIEDDYIFPVFSVDDKKELGPEQKIKLTSDKKSARPSPHVLDLKNKNLKNNIPDFSNLTPQNYNQPVYNLENYLSNSEKPNYNNDFMGDKLYYLRQINFELPEDRETLDEKPAFHKPKKYKNKNNIKLNLGQNFNKSLSSAPVKPELKLPILLKFIVKIFSLLWSIISAPFVALDFLVDRSLKTAWWLIKTIILTIINIFLLFFSNLKKIFSLGLPHRLTLPPIAQAESHHKKNLKKIFKLLLPFGLVCLVIILPLQLITLKQKTSLIKGQVLGESMAGLAALKNASEFSQDYDFTKAEQEFEKAYLSFSLAKKYLDGLDAFSQEIVKLAPEGKIAENLLIIGQLSSQMGQDFTTLIDNFSNLNKQNNLMAKISLAEETLKHIEPNFLELSQRIKNLDTTTLEKYLDENTLQKIILFQGALPAIEENFNKIKTLINFLADFLGNDKTKSYLFVFQNNNELRATGGFMGSFALVEIHKGIITKLEVPGGGFYDLKAANQTLVEAPKPFQLFSPNWSIWNANWFPDWPSSAQKISWFYEKSLAGITTDGVVALTPNVLSDLLKITGPIAMPEYQKTITADNLIVELQKAVELEYDKEENKPKKIIGNLLPKILEKIFQTDSKTAIPLISTLFKNANEKNILVWFNEAEMQNTINKFSWTGEIKNSPQDFLMVVHTNASGGKTDLVIKNKISHQVTINEQGKIIDTVNLTRTHQGNINDIFEKETNVDYVRFYVPENSKLIEAKGFDVIPANLFKTADANTKKDSDLLALEKNPTLDESSNTRITDEFNKTVFGNWLIVKPGEEKTVTISYELPFQLALNQKQNWWQKVAVALTGKNKTLENIGYSLLIQKQAGVKEVDFSSQIVLPSNLKIINSSGKNALSNNLYQDNLNIDGYYEIEIGD